MPPEDRGAGVAPVRVHGCQLGRHKVKHYEAGTIRDYGSLIDLTAAATFQGPEDGAVKLELVIPHHSTPTLP